MAFHHIAAFYDKRYEFDCLTYRELWNPGLWIDQGATQGCAVEYFFFDASGEVEFG
jgi:hypothetical protein